MRGNEGPSSLKGSLVAMSMTAGHLIKNYFELFRLKIGVNDINLEI